MQGLRGMDKNGFSDPYVKLFLQPRSKLVSIYWNAVHHAMTWNNSAAKVSHKNDPEDTEPWIPGNLHLHWYIQRIPWKEEAMVSEVILKGASHIISSLFAR